VPTDIGVTYGFRYRVRNVYGWSEFSPITYILAADVPEQPPRPTFVEASDNSIKIQLYPAPFNGGIYIEKYTLEMD